MTRPWVVSSSWAFGATAADVATARGASNVYLRYAYGLWKVGNCKLQAGQMDTPYGPLGYHPRQYLGWITDSKLLLLGWGFAYTGRKPGISFEWSSGNFGFTIQLVQPMAQDEWQSILDKRGHRHGWHGRLRDSASLGCGHRDQGRRLQHRALHLHR